MHLCGDPFQSQSAGALYFATEDFALTGNFAGTQCDGRLFESGQRTCGTSIAELALEIMEIIIPDSARGRAHNGRKFTAQIRGSGLDAFFAGVFLQGPTPRQDESGY